jgi:NADH:ubiquinone oxidoreductase subunit 6 (subunit J)
MFSAVTLGSALMVIMARNPVHSVFFLILSFFSTSGLFVMLGAEFLAMLLMVVYVGAVAVLFLFVVMMLDIPAPTLKSWFIPRLKEFCISFGILLCYLIIFFAAAYLMMAALSFVSDWGFGIAAINPTELTLGPVQALTAIREPFSMEKFHPWSEFISACVTLLISALTGRQLAMTVMKKPFWKLMGNFVRQGAVGVLLTVIFLGELLLVFHFWGDTERAQEMGLLHINAESLLPNTHALGQVLYTDYLYIFQTSGLILLVAMIGAIVLTHRHKSDSKRQDIRSQNNRRKEDVVELVKVEPGEGVKKWT